MVRSAGERVLMATSRSSEFSDWQLKHGIAEPRSEAHIRSSTSRMASSMGMLPCSASISHEGLKLTAARTKTVGILRSFSQGGGVSQVDLWCIERSFAPLLCSNCFSACTGPIRGSCDASSRLPVLLVYFGIPLVRPSAALCPHRHPFAMEGTEAQDASTAKKGRAPRRKAAKTQDDGNTLAAALVNRLPRADLEDLMLEAMRSGAVPLEHVKARLPENRRELVSQKIDVVAKDLRSGAVGAFAALPNEVQLLIFSMLPFVDRLRAAALVCRSWRELLKVPVLWESAEFEWGFLKKPPRHFTLSSISRLFGRAEGCFKTLDLANIRKIHYQATSDLSSPDLKKIFAWTPNVVDLELSGEKSLTDHAIQQASKAYAPNLRRFVVRNSKIYADTVVKILDQNPNIEDLCLMMHYISAAELARFARAGSALRPGGAHGFSRIVRLSLNTDRHSLSVDPAAIAQLGSLFSELEYLHISGFTTHSRSSNSDLAVPLPALEPMPRLRTLLIDHILVGLSSTFQVPNPARPQETVDRLFRNLVSIIHAACSSKLETLGLDVDTNFVLKKEKLQGAKQQPLPLLAGALQLPGGWPKLRQLGLRGMRVAAAPGRFTTEEKELLTAIDAPELRFVVGGKLGAQDDLQEMVKVLVETTGQRWRQGGSGSGMDEWMRLSTYRSTAWSRSD